MMAFGFLSPLMLLGLLAVAIPLVLHLLARSRAQEMLFPTLRFLRISMEKTARRRRIQQMLLMFLRMALLGLFVFAVAEPISQALGGWTGDGSYACVLIVDNSMSMSASAGPGAKSRLGKARSEAEGILNLGAKERPALGALWTTNGPMAGGELTGNMEDLRTLARAIAPSFGKAPLAQRVAAAVAELQKHSVPQKVIAVFSDLQKVTFDELLAADDLAKAKDVHLLVINTADRAAVNNLAVTEVSVKGRAIVGQLQTVTATVVNADPDSNHVADVVLRVGGEREGQPVRLNLAAAGQEESNGVATFKWWPRQTGVLGAEVAIERDDDLPLDNAMPFALRVGGRIRAVVVRGPPADPCQVASDPAWMLNLALQPFGEGAARLPAGLLNDPNWDLGRAVEANTVDSQDFAPSHLQGAEIVFLCDVPKFTAEQAAALESLAGGGGTVVIFCGPNVEVQNYNDVLGRRAGPEGGLLPAPLAPAVGDLGPTAGALFLNWVDLDHPYFKGLWEQLSDVKADIRGSVQRRYRLQLERTSRPPAVLVGLDNDEPLIVSKPFGLGRVVLCATSAAPGWSNLPATSLFPPMVIRMGLLARKNAAHEEGFLAESPVTIRPRLETEADELAVEVTPPPAAADGNVQIVHAVRTGEGLAARFTQTAAAGLYRWRTRSPVGAEHDEYGSFVVSPPAEESLLEQMTPEALRAGLEKKGFNRAYVGATLAEAKQAALDAAQKRNWWDLFAAAAIVALVVESLVANRSRKHLESAVPAHLNPKIAA